MADALSECRSELQPGGDGWGRHLDYYRATDDDMNKNIKLVYFVIEVKNWPSLR